MSSLDDLANRVRKMPGVVGVFRGRPRRREAWAASDADVLCAHVRWKRPHDALGEHERLPPEVDVVEVGLPHADELDHTDAVLADRGRRSTVTMLCRHHDGFVYALMSGHGVLPVTDGRLQRLVVDDAAGLPVEVADTIEGTLIGRLMRGALGDGRSFDWSLVRFGQDRSILPFHFAAGASFPLPLRQAPLEVGMPVLHYSSTRGRGTIRGTVVQVARTTSEMQLPDRAVTEYAQLIVVANEPGSAFSEPGDSGSLVVDSDRRVVGAIVGSSRTAGIAYVYDMRHLLPELGGLRGSFFS